jgi:signal transduction histidine kinase/CheY-like chemotaxis protein
LSSQTGDGFSSEQAARLKALGVEEFTILETIKNGVANGSLHGPALTTELLTGKTVEDRIRAEFSAVQASQRQMLAAQQAQVQNYENAVRIITIASLVLGVGAGVLTMVLVLRLIIRRIGDVRRNTEKFLNGEEVERFWVADDEVGGLQSLLLGASALVRERERELQVARDEAIAATQAKDEFLSRISHELRTPLTAVLGFGQLLQLEQLGEENADSVNHIVAAGEHLLALINDILDISRIEAGEISMSLEAIVLAEVVEESLSLLRPLAASRRVNLLSSDIGGVVQADRQRLKQVLLNLVSNAIKYNREEGTVTISSGGATPTTLVCTVADTGVGIAAQDMDRLFQPFDRLGAETMGVEGTGVGLSLSKALTEAMHGSLTAESVQGEGSAFHVTLPIGTLSSAGVSGNGHGGGAGTPGAATVLYAEDNLASLRVVERLFAGRSETLQVAIQGKMVLELAKELRPSLILLDLHLPDMDGEEVLHQLRRDPVTSEIPVVILSADATPGRLERLVDQGAAAYLTKPLQLPLLLEILDRLGGAH